MDQNLTDITVVMDRSGSMAAVRAEAEGGLNAFIDEQKKQPGEALFTLVQFDTEYEFIHTAKPIKDVIACALVPRGWTALLDALGRAIAETGNRLAGMEEVKRPGLVVFVVVTDGQENASKEYTFPQVKEIIETQQRDYAWKFTFLGADPSTFAVANQLGISAASVAQYDPVKKTAGAHQAASNLVCRSRSLTAGGQSAADMDFAYTEEEKKSLK